MKKLLSSLLSLLMLCTAPAFALEITDEDCDYWYQEMTYLVDEIGIRKVGFPGEITARDYLRSVFEGYGFSYEEGTLFEIHAPVPEWNIDDSTSLVAIKRAKNENPNILTLCAHYDSVYQGARDNASGVAALLMLMRIYAEQDAFDDTELRFIAFSAEESGHQGSTAYCAQLTEDEIARSIGVFNVDIITVDVWEELCFAIDTVGMRTEAGYVTGSIASPAYNRVALATLAAMEETGYYDEADLDLTWCLPRHMGASDHESFHLVGIDSANICFHRPIKEHGWTEFMHTPSDVMGDFDLDRTWQALETLYTAFDGLANDPTYGD